MIKLFEMFAGYGGASFALKKAEIPFECVGYSEINKYAIQCYEQNHPNIKNYGDCCKINPNELPDFDLLTGGFPCQDVSIAGQRDLSKGRTNLFYEIIRIAKVKKPKYMLLENVKGLLSAEKFKLNKTYFDKIKEELKRIGYGICYTTLNSKDYGIPQNRERIWIVCKLDGWDFMEFGFPEGKPLKIMLKDILEPNVSEKYNVSEKALKLLKARIGTSYTSKFNPNISNTLRTNYGNAYSNETYIKRVQIDISGKGYKSQQDRYYYSDGIMSCLPNANPTNKVNIIDGETIRRLTPKECFRLMGFLNDEINIVGISDGKAYSLAGNGWDINLVSLIFKKMFPEGY